MEATERTNVIVVGAGASREFDLPTGAELTELLSSNLAFKTDAFGMVNRKSGNSDLLSAIVMLATRNGDDPGHYIDKATLISKNMSLAPSIDNFLDTHRGDHTLVTVGKLAISHALIEAERKSLLRIDESNSYNRLAFSRVTNTWAAVFFKIIAAKRDFESFLKALGNITFIVFNYDRCIEQFFINAAISYFDLDQVRAGDVKKAIQIVRPYGSLGDLSVRFTRTEGYAPKPSPEKIIAAANGLRTFTEGVKEESVVNLKDEAFSAAELVIFLGFSFIDINLEFLKPKECNAKRVLATAKGRSKDTKILLHNSLVSTYLGAPYESVELFDGKCFELFYEFDHYLMREQP